MAADQPTRRTQPVQLAKKYATLAIRRYQALHLYGKLFVWGLLCFYIAVGVTVVVITPEKIFQALYDTVHKLSLQRFGWLALAGAIVFVSFPPLFGHTTITMMCGFAYGMKGFWIASTASIIGSALAFVILRMLFHRKLRQFSDNDKWAAFVSVIRAKGLPLIVLIRVSPLPPWVYSNALFASVDAVPLWKFAFATLFVFPKLALHVFIGSRMAALSDGKQRHEMDRQTKILNGSLVGGGIVIAFFASWLIYSLIRNHIRRLEGIPSDVDELAAEYIEEFDPTASEDAPLLGSNTD